MKLLLALTVFGFHWIVPNVADWKVDQEGGRAVLHLITGREPPPGPRRPRQFAIAEMPAFHQVTVDADVKPLQRSLMIVFAYRDQAHFDYAHLSIDAGTKEPNHNGIFHVYGGERVRISSVTGPPAFSQSNRWYHVHLSFNGTSGVVEVFVNGQPIPALRAVDLSLPAGRVGIGSFDETGDFRNLRITGN